MANEDYVVVFRGFDPAGLDLVEAMLQAEGITARRVGKASASMLGVGNAAVEQLIAVAPEQAEEARALLAAAEHAPGQAGVDDLEAQALSAKAPAPDEARDDDAPRGPDTRVALVGLIALAIVLYWLLK